jgi:hypothetical protein
MELLNKAARRLPRPPCTAPAGWLRIPPGWTTLVLAAILVIV